MNVSIIQASNDLFTQPTPPPSREQGGPGFAGLLEQRSRDNRPFTAPAADHAQSTQRDARSRTATGKDQASRTHREDAQQRSEAAHDRRERRRVDDRKDDRRDDITDDRAPRTQRDDANRVETSGDESTASTGSSVADAARQPSEDNAAIVADASAESADDASVVARVEVRPATQAANQSAAAATTTADAAVAAAGSQSFNQTADDSAQQAHGSTLPLENAAKASTESTFKVIAPSVPQADSSAAATATTPSSGRIEVQPTQAAAQAHAPTPAPQLDSDGVLARVARGLHNAVQQNGGTVTMRLNPPELGVLRIELAMNNGTATVRFQTEHTSVRELLNQQLHTLRQGLEGHGVTVERLDVQTSSNASRENNYTQQGDDGRSRGQFTQQGRQGGSQDEPSQRQAARSFLEEFNAVA